MMRFFEWVRSRINTRRRFDLWAIVAAIFILSLGIAPLAHELTALMIRPKVKTIAVSSTAKPAVAVAPPPLLPVLAGFSVIAAGILLAAIVASSQSPWDDSAESLREALKKQLIADGHYQAIWWLAETSETDDAGHGQKLRNALARHHADGFPNIAPIRGAGAGVVSAATLLAMAAAASAFAIHVNATALPAATWLRYAKTTIAQTDAVAHGGLNAVSLVFMAAAALVGFVGLLIGWLLGRSLPSATPVIESAASSAEMNAPIGRSRVLAAAAIIVALIALFWRF